MSATMKIVCGWCGKNLGTKPCSPQMAGQTTHGICEKCAAKLVKGGAK